MTDAGMKITRLKLFADGLFDEGEPEIAPDPNGAYVRYEAYLAALAAAEEKGRRDVFRSFHQAWADHRAKSIICCERNCFCWDLEMAFDDILPDEPEVKL